MEEKTIKILRKSGWYEERNIDISENLNLLKYKGFEIFDSAIDFMKNFGELNIIVKRMRMDGSIKIARHTTCIKDIIGILDSSHFGLDNFVDHEGNRMTEKVLPVGAISNFELYLYISENGKMYRNNGWIGNSPLEAFDNIICEKGGKPWSDIYYD